jgi:hypothetical protein
LTREPQARIHATIHDGAKQCNRNSTDRGINTVRVVVNGDGIAQNEDRIVFSLSPPLRLSLPFHLSYFIAESSAIRLIDEKLFDDVSAATDSLCYSPSRLLWSSRMQSNASGAMAGCDKLKAHCNAFYTRASSTHRHQSPVTQR